MWSSESTKLPLPKITRFGRKRGKFSAFLGKARHQNEKKGKREKEENKKLFGSLAFLQGAAAAAAAAAAAP